MDFEVTIGNRICYDIASRTIIVGMHLAEEFYVRALNHEILHHVIRKEIGVEASVKLDDWFVARLTDLTAEYVSERLIDRLLRRDVEKRVRSVIDYDMLLQYYMKFQWSDEIKMKGLNEVK